MAEAAVSFVIERLGDLLLTEAKFLYGVTGQVEDAQAKLHWMRSFLKDADANVKQGDERVRLWVVQIRETAYALEDVIETFVLKVASKRKGGIKNALKRSVCILTEGIELHKFGSEIEKISSSISSLTSSLRTYGIRELTVKEGATSSNQRQRELRRAYSHVVEHDVVGFDKNIKELVAHLTTKGNPHSHRVVSVCGMGGLGKTTLARKVYHHAQVRTHFDCFAWASISQQCEIEIRDVWEGVLIKLTSPTMSKTKREEISKMRDDEIAKELYNLQKQRKCLVLLDDIWTTSTWDRLKAAFPEDETNSKILLTTRKKNVALHADKNGLIHEPRCLSESESWELFEKKSLFGMDATNSKDNERKEEIVREMLRHCAGLPLAIILLSGLLSTKHTIDEWETLNKNVMTFLSRGKEQDEQEYQGVSSVLGLSYDELPFYLKPCFLYLARYPEDFRIEVKKLCHTLIAEGFIPMNHQRRSSMETVEDIAYNHLSELVERHMVQVEKWGSTGRMKSFRIHDLMRDLCLFKAQEENFLQFVDLRNRDEPVESVSFGTKTNVKPRNKVRRVAIYANHHVSDLLPFIDNGEGSLRCLIFVNRGVEPRKQVFKPLFNRFRMLRVLNLDNMLTPSFSGKLPKEIGKLIHLRLLSLDNSNVESIPSSIGNLRCLQTLNLAARMKRWEVPNVMWKLQQLRHLYLPMSFYVSGKCLRLTNVSNLQTLLVVPTKYLDVNDFQQLTNLKKLGICVDKNIGRIFHNPPSVRFNCVRSLHVHNKEDDMIDIIPVILSYPQIYKLELWSPIIKLPEDYQFSPNLMKLVLGDTYLKDDPMSTIEKLPNLRVASIRRYCFKGNEMVCSKGGFPRLELLEFFAVFKLKEWKVEEGALPSLCHLRIRSCRKLSRVPDGLRYVTTLKEIEIENMPREFITRVEEGGEDFYKVQHVPSIVTNFR